MHPHVLHEEAFNAFYLGSCGEILGIMSNTIFNHSGFAVNLTSVILSLALIMARVLSVNLTPGFRPPRPGQVVGGEPWHRTLSKVRLSTCTKVQQLSNGICPIRTGQQVLEPYKLDSDPGRSLAALGACTIAYRIATYILLKATKMPPFQDRLQRFKWTKRLSLGKSHLLKIVRSTV